MAVVRSPRPFQEIFGIHYESGICDLSHCDYSALALWFSCSQRCLKYFQSQTFALERT